MVVAYFALGAILALVNFVEFAVAWTIEQRVFGDRARPRVVGAYAVAFVIGLGRAQCVAASIPPGAPL